MSQFKVIYMYTFAIEFVTQSMSNVVLLATIIIIIIKLLSQFQYQCLLKVIQLVPSGLLDLMSL